MSRLFQAITGNEETIMPRKKKSEQFEQEERMTLDKEIKERLKPIHELIDRLARQVRVPPERRSKPFTI